LSNITLIDTHCHLDYITEGLHGHEPNTNLSEILKNAAEKGVKWVINPGVEPAAWNRVLAVSDQFPNVFAALAVHPCGK
jgi:TatD DNase family protein